MSPKRPIAKYLRAALAGPLLIAAIGFSPAQAAASRLSSDRIGIVPLSAGTVAASKAPDINARSGRLVSWQGRQLWSRGATTRRHMASTTKVMTAIVVLESCNLTDTVRVTSAASHIAYAMGLRTYERRTVRQLLEYLLVASSNDAAAALAIHVSGSVPNFARRMNAKAHELGLANTRYVNPHGLDASGHYTSASDLARLMKVAMQKPEFRRIVLKRSVYLPAYRGRPARTIASTNKLLGHVSGLRGGKTGYTDDARYCYVANAKRGGITLTVTVLGSTSSSARFASAKRLLDWGFAHYRIRRITTTTQTAAAVPMAGNADLTVPARFAEATSAAVFDLGGAIVRQSAMVTSIAAPVFAGMPLGDVVLTQAGSVLATVPALAAADRASAEETVGTLPVADISGRTVTLKTAESTAAVRAFDPSRPVDRTMNLPASVSAPVVAGQQLGSVTYSQDGSEIVTVPVIAAEDVSSESISEAAGTLLRTLAQQVLSIPRLAGSAFAGLA